MCIRIVFHTSNSSSTNFSGWYFLHMFFGTCEVFPKEAVNKKKITENIIPITTTHHKTAQIFWIYHLTCVALIFRNWSCLLLCMTLCMTILYDLMLPPNIKGLLCYFLLVKNIVHTKMNMLQSYTPWKASKS